MLPSMCVCDKDHNNVIRVEIIALLEERRIEKIGEKKEISAHGLKSFSSFFSKNQFSVICNCCLCLYGGITN